MTRTSLLTSLPLCLLLAGTAPAAAQINLQQPSHVTTFVEAVVGVPWQEQDILSWAVMLNLEPTPQEVILRIFLDGQPAPVEYRYTIAGYQRLSKQLNYLPVFRQRPAVFSLQVEFTGGNGKAQLVMRNAHHPWVAPTLPPPQ